MELVSIFRRTLSYLLPLFFFPLLSIMAIEASKNDFFDAASLPAVVARFAR